MRTLIEPRVTVVVFLIRNGRIFLQTLEDGSLGGFELRLESDVSEVKSNICERLGAETSAQILPRNLNNRILMDRSGDNPSSTWVYSVSVFHIDPQFGELESYDADSVPYNRMNPLHASCLQSAPFFTGPEDELIRITVK